MKEKKNSTLKFVTKNALNLLICSYVHGSINHDHMVMPRSDRFVYVSSCEAV